jgi:hypothetical protein
MADKNILIQKLVMAKNIDSLNRSFVHTAEVENGMVFQSVGRSTDADKAEVFTITAPATGALTGLWMAYEPEVVLTTSGNSVYKGLDPDVRNFAIPIGTVFTGFKPMAGDIIQMTGGGALAGTKSTNTYVNASNGTMALTWGSSQTASALSAKLLETGYVSITDGSTIGGNQRVTAYTFEVLAN